MRHQWGRGRGGGLALHPSASHGNLCYSPDDFDTLFGLGARRVMAQVVAISGSPAEKSRSSAVLDYAKSLLIAKGHTVVDMTIRDLPADDLLYGNFRSPALAGLHQTLDQSQGVIIATPVYKASYPGGLKALLDLMPQYGLAGKIVLPIATGGSLNHLLAIDYAMKPLFSVMGATHILRGVYILSEQVKFDDNGTMTLESDIDERLTSAVNELASTI